MKKYALVLAFTYNRVLGARYDIQSLHSSVNDVDLIISLCESKGILPENITVVMDLQPGKRLNSRINRCNLKTNPFPSDSFVCREISQFIENTVRGIDDSSYKNEDLESCGPEILLYLSCHGKRICNDKQGIVLTNEDGTSLKFLLARDIFRLIFGYFPINEIGESIIPVYSEYQIKKTTDKGSYIERIYNEESVLISLSPPIESPSISPIVPISYRSSYMTRRGLPVSSKLLIIVDTCYSEHMAYFPYVYNEKSQSMSLTGRFETDIGIDLPYCVSISSCEVDKTTGFVSESSSLTGILFRLLTGYNECLNIAQLHYSIYNSGIPKINDILRKGIAHPIITSTSNLSDIEIPFFTVPKNKIVNVIEK